MRVSQSTHKVVRETGKVGFINFKNNFFFYKITSYAEAIWAISSSIDVYREMNEPSKVGQLTTAVVLCALALNNPNQADELLSKSATLVIFN